MAMKNKNKIAIPETLPIDSAALSASVRNIFASINKALTDAFLGIDWDRMKIEINAYSALRSHLDAAINDPKVQQSESLLKLTESIRLEIGRLGPGDSEKQFHSNVGNKLAERRKSEAASKNAKSKNQEARNFVHEEWGEHIAIPTNSKNKKGFAARILPNVMEKFNIKNLKATTIERDWLPKNRPHKPT
jgi:hypothetical protein